MSRQTKNLSLDPEAIRRGELYSELHQTSISQLVSNFLASLPLDEPRPPSPAVGRLLGIAAGGGAIEEYHAYLVERYGE